jgi:hypothetical protein
MNFNSINNLRNYNLQNNHLRNNQTRNTQFLNNPSSHTQIRNIHFLNNSRRNNNNNSFSLTEEQENLLNIYRQNYNYIANEIEYLYSRLDIINENIFILTSNINNNISQPYNIINNRQRNINQINNEVRNNELRNNNQINNELRNNELRNNELRNINQRNNELRNNEVRNNELINNELRNNNTQPLYYDIYFETIIPSRLLNQNQNQNQNQSQTNQQTLELTQQQTTQQQTTQQQTTQQQTTQQQTTNNTTTNNTSTQQQTTTQQQTNQETQQQVENETIFYNQLVTSRPLITYILEENINTSFQNTLLNSLFDNILNNNFNLFENEINIPTQQEKNKALIISKYENLLDKTNEECPITLNKFNNDDEVAQIKKCKHIFTANQLNIWFQSNVKCPTCRYDIRNYNDEEEETNLNNQSNNIQENNLNNNNQLHIYDISNNEVNFETFNNFFDTL